jgi:hypothetical protein
MQGYGQRRRMQNEKIGIVQVVKKIHTVHAWGVLANIHAVNHDLGF